MKQITLYLAALIFSVGVVSLYAGGDVEIDVEKKIVTALKTDDFELAEIDISDLSIGDAETIVTDSGKTIDLLRTQDGVEVYIDGKLLDTGMSGEGGPHDEHQVIHKHVEVICDDNEDCDKHVWISEDEGLDPDAFQDKNHKVIMIHKEKIDGGVEVIIDEDSEMHSGDHGERVIIIEKTAESI